MVLSIKFYSPRISHLLWATAVVRMTEVVSGVRACSARQSGSCYWCSGCVAQTRSSQPCPLAVVQAGGGGMLGSGSHASKGARHVAAMQAAMRHEGGLRGMQQLTMCSRLLVVAPLALGIVAAAAASCAGDRRKRRGSGRRELQPVPRAVR
jgi:hypothetical protein